MEQDQLQPSREPCRRMVLVPRSDSLVQISQPSLHHPPLLVLDSDSTMKMMLRLSTPPTDQLPRADQFGILRIFLSCCPAEVRAGEWCSLILRTLPEHQIVSKLRRKGELVYHGRRMTKKREWRGSSELLVRIISKET